LFYINKTNKQDIIELIYSDEKASVVVSQKDTLENGTPTGKIIRETKKELKKRYKKIKADHKLVKVQPVSDEDFDMIMETYKRDRYGILQHTENYIEKDKRLDYLEYHKNLSEEDYVDNLVKLSDSYQKTKNEGDED
jgi:hypothetical protein